MSQVMGAFGLLDFTMLRSFLFWRTFGTYKSFISLIFQIFFSGRGKPRIIETVDTESADTRVRLYIVHDEKLFLPALYKLI